MPEFQRRRCFVAIPLDEVCRADLADVMDALEVEGLRLTKPENLHVTLKFLGDVEDPVLPGILKRLREAASGVSPFELGVVGIDYLPDARRARVVAARCDMPQPLTAMYEAVEATLQEAGFPREGRAYHPHITLGRFRKPPRRPPPPPEVSQFAPTGFTVDRVVLMQSDLGSGGPTYTPLADMPLGV